MARAEIKKLLIDLDTSVAAIARSIGRKRPTVYAYFDGRLKKPAVRRSIQRFLDRRGKALGYAVPRLWDADAPQREEVAR
jgi:AcrR family transcriptional regulator